MKQSKNRVAQLDSLRGIAAMLVIFHHGRQAFENSVDDVWTGLSAYLDLGRLGVVIFFMISGFVIVKAIRDRTTGAALTFWKHRFFRLYPPFWVSVLVAALLAALAGRSQCCAFLVPATPSGFLANMTMLPLRFHQPMLIGIYWTLELELLFYILVSVITLMGRNSFRSMSVIAIGLFASALAVAGRVAMTSGTGDIGKNQMFLALLHLSLMFSGAATRYHWDAHGRREGFLESLPVLLKVYFLLMCCFFVAVAALKVRHGIDPHTFRVAATYILAVATFFVFLRAFNGSRLGTFMGDRSYGIYLLHIPAFTLVSYALSQIHGLQLGYPLYLATAILLTLAGADLLRRFVERPAIRFGQAHGSHPRRDAWRSEFAPEPAVTGGSALTPDAMQDKAAP